MSDQSKAMEITNGVTILDSVITKGNLADLSPKERVTYYAETCRSLGINPLTQPFAYLSLNGKLVLYATRGATDQLRAVHHVAITRLERETVGDVFMVTASARLPDGRTDESIGAVSIKGLIGDALANGYMKAETKAKRRVTLSIVGLGWLDESEIETIPTARQVSVNTETGEIEATTIAPSRIAPAKAAPVADDEDPWDEAPAMPAPTKAAPPTNQVPFDQRELEAIQARELAEMGQKAPPPLNGNAITSAQMRAIFAIGRGQKGLTEQQIEQMCQAQFHAKPNDLTRKQASDLITALQGSQG